MKKRLVIVVESEGLGSGVTMQIRADPRVPAGQMVELLTGAMRAITVAAEQMDHNAGGRDQICRCLAAAFNESTGRTAIVAGEAGPSPEDEGERN